MTHITLNNEIAKEAIKNVIHTNESTFITGNSSTGKSTFKRFILEYTNKKHLVLAPTKFEAIKTGEVSIQSFFKLDTIKYDSNLNLTGDLDYCKEQINFIEELELIVIDEISLVTSKELDMINLILQKIRKNSNPMGEVQLLIVGDLFESSPKLNKEILKEVKAIWKSQHFFDAKCYESIKIKTFYLNDTYLKRQRYEYIDFLNLLKQNRLRGEFLMEYNLYHSTPKSNHRNSKVIITISNKKANIINETILQFDPQLKSLFGEINGDFNKDLLPVQQLIKVAIGSRVILTNDSNINAEYKNGTIGIIKEICNGIAKVETENYGLLSICQKEWINYEYQVDSQSGKFEKKVIGIFTQYPIKLGWAISIDESKGMIFDDIHFENKENSRLKNEEAYRVYSRYDGNMDKFSTSFPLKEEDINSDLSKLEYYYGEIFNPMIDIQPEEYMYS